jgi:hypothetical protein
MTLRSMILWLRSILKNAQELSHGEWLALLLDREATERYQRRLRARLRYARLRHQARGRRLPRRRAGLTSRKSLQAPDIMRSLCP